MEPSTSFATTNLNLLRAAAQAFAVGAKQVVARKLELSGLVFSLAIICSAGSAQAAMETLPHPGVKAGEAIRGFAVSGNYWFALTGGRDLSSTVTPRLSKDGGKSWRTIGASILADGATRGPDGAFYFVQRDSRSARIARVEPGAGSISYLPAALPSYGETISPPEFDDRGNAWVLVTGHWSKLLQISPSGSAITDARTADPNDNVYQYKAHNARVKINRYGTFVGVGSKLWELEDGALKQLAPAGVPEVAYEDGLVLFQSGISYDGARTVYSFAPPPMFTQGISAVEGSGGSLILANGQVQRRYSSQVFSPTGIKHPNQSSFPNDSIRSFKTDRGILLVDDKSHDPRCATSCSSPASNIYLFDGPVPESPAKPGNIEPDSREMVDEANRLRADSGLPPLVVDPLASKASRNHARYIALNDVGHFEDASKPGFTGATPGDRCKAVGASCGGEVAHGISGAAAVTDWMTTIYHRPLVGSPEASAVGAGSWSEGGSREGAVMNGVGASGAFPVRPVVMPLGDWRGNLGFSGECPDPGANCPDPKTPISAPYGVAVTVFTPRGLEVKGPITLIDTSTGQRVRGCYFPEDKAFVPDDPLKANVEYQASAVLAAKGQPGYPESTLEWTFKGTKGGSTEGAPTEDLEPVTCRPTITTNFPRKLNRRKAVSLRWEVCDQGTVRISLQRKDARKPALAKTIKIPNADRGTSKIRLSRIPRGTYTLRASISSSGETSESITRRVTIRR